MTDALPRGLYEAPFELERPEKASQTLLSHLDSCPYSGALYLKHKGGPQTGAMARGEAFHDFAERAIDLMRADAEESGSEIGHLPPDAAKDHMQAVLEERVDLTVPAPEQDACRAMSWNFAAATVISPETVAGVEQMLELQIGNWTVRGKLDLLLRGDGWITVKDWKTSLYVQPIDDYQESFQPLTYGLLALEGVPEGGGTPIGKGLPMVRTEEVYPRYRKGADGAHIDDYDVAPGEMVTRYAEYDRPRLADHKRTIESLLAKLDHGLETGQWSAQESSHCNICPARAECPIPLEAREIKTIGTEGDAREVASRVVAREAEVRADKAALKAWVGENGALVVGDEEWNFTLERRETANKDAIKELIRECGQELDDFYKESMSTRFGKKKVKAAA